MRQSGAKTPCRWSSRIDLCNVAISPARCRWNSMQTPLYRRFKQKSSKWQGAPISWRKISGKMAGKVRVGGKVDPIYAASRCCGVLEWVLSTLQSVPNVLILLMSLPFLLKQCWNVSAHSETSCCFYYLMQREVQDVWRLLREWWHHKNISKPESHDSGFVFCILIFILYIPCSCR